MKPLLKWVIAAGCLMSLLVVCSSAQLSEKTRAEIVAAFPKFEPPPADPTPPAPTTDPTPLSNDPLVKLPDFQIREKRVPDKDPDLWLSRRAISHKAMAEYSDSMTDLEWWLNSWHIPFITPSAQARANARYANNKIMNEQKRLTSIIKTVAQLDSAEAKKLLHDLDLSGHAGK